MSDTPWNTALYAKINDMANGRNGVGNGQISILLAVHEELERLNNHMDLQLERINNKLEGKNNEAK